MLMWDTEREAVPMRGVVIGWIWGLCFWGMGYFCYRVARFFW
jgi:hypothetical protein